MLWVANPLLPPEPAASLKFSEHFNIVVSSLASRKGTNVPVLISAVSTGWRKHRADGQTMGRCPQAMSSVHTRAYTQRNDMEIEACRLVPAVMNKVPPGTKPTTVATAKTSTGAKDL